MNKIVVGIDLGTDKCCLTYQDNIGRPFIITDDKNYKISSIIGILNNGILVGNEISKDSIYDIPIITNLKRLIGHSSTDKEAILIASYNGWILEDSNDGNDLIIIINNQKYYLSNLLCLLLNKIKNTIISNIGENFDVIITVPANFNEGQKNAILNYCKKVGLTCQRLLYEPCSAALTYIHYLNPDIKTDQTQKIVVFDFGAGTLDLAVVSCDCLIDDEDENRVEWLSNIEKNIGDNSLGGIDIDIQLANFLYSKFPDFKNKLQSKNESINFIIEKIKIRLSKLYETSQNQNLSIIEVYYNQVLTISLDEYFTILDQHFKNRIINLLDQLHNKIKIDEITDVLLIGGSSYNPWIKLLISNYYHKEIKDYKLTISDHFEQYKLDIKDIGVSLGATCACLGKKMNKYGSVLVLTESLPLSIGIETVNSMMCKILEKNSMIPCSSKQYFTTSEDNQTKIEIKLFQGERDNVNDNFFLGSFIMDDLEPLPLGKAVIVVEVSVTTDGLITVQGKVKNTDKYSKKAIINRYDYNLNYRDIEVNIKSYEQNDTIFNNIIKKYYKLTTMLNKLQFNLLDNVSCKVDVNITNQIIGSFWDNLIMIHNLMKQSDKLKNNIAQLTKTINYIQNSLNLNYESKNIDLLEDKTIAIKLDLLIQFIETNHKHLVSAYQIPASDIKQDNYDTYNDNTHLNQINSIYNSTEILEESDKTLIYELELSQKENKTVFQYLIEIKDLSVMIVNNITDLNISDNSKLFILEFIDKYDLYIDYLVKMDIGYDKLDGELLLKQLQDTCMMITEIDDKLIDNLYNQLIDIKIENIGDMIDMIKLTLTE
jgi:molecular chaperone DnaK (HSP70)